MIIYPWFISPYLEAGMGGLSDGGGSQFPDEMMVLGQSGAVVTINLHDMANQILDASIIAAWDYGRALNVLGGNSALNSRLLGIPATVELKTNLRKFFIQLNTERFQELQKEQKERLDTLAQLLFANAVANKK